MTEFLNDKGFNAEMIMKKLADIGVIRRGDGGHTLKKTRVEGELKRMIVIDREKLETL